MREPHSSQLHTSRTLGSIVVVRIVKQLKRKQKNGMESLIQSILLAAGAATVSTIITASVVFHTLVNRLEVVTNSRQLRLPHDPVEHCLKSWGECILQPSTEDEKSNDNVRPKVAWLMSFPNSGTSYTIHIYRIALQLQIMLWRVWSGTSQVSLPFLVRRGGRDPFWSLFPI